MKERWNLARSLMETLNTIRSWFCGGSLSICDAGLGFLWNRSIWQILPHIQPHTGMSVVHLCNFPHPIHIKTSVVESRNPYNSEYFEWQHDVIYIQSLLLCLKTLYCLVLFQPMHALYSTPQNIGNLLSSHVEGQELKTLQLYINITTLYQPCTFIYQ